MRGENDSKQSDEFQAILHNARGEIDCEQSLIFFFAKLVTQNPSTRAAKPRAAVRH